MMVLLWLAALTLVANGAISNTLTGGTFTDNSITTTSISLTISVGTPVAISFPELTSVSSFITIRMSNWNTISRIEFPKLKTVTGAISFEFAVGNCQTISMPLLQSAASMSFNLGNNGDFAKSSTWVFGNTNADLVISGALSADVNAKLTGSVLFPGLKSTGSVTLTARNEGNGIASSGSLQLGSSANSR
jgi:hypothetical protein